MVAKKLSRSILIIPLAIISAIDRDICTTTVIDITNTAS